MKGVIVLGTASDSGKSMICTALCRLFANEQIRVAPFKSQNLSSFTEPIGTGEEISRAQYIQAIAAKTEPSLYMNPIMLKPQGNMQSEVLMLGESFGAVKGFDYRIQFFEQAVQAIQHSLDQLSKTYEMVVIEGAGSPVEVNLNDREIVNMRVAEIADVPALLVAHIDKGGAIASIVGTLALLEERQRSRVKGIIINKFHGDVSLFQGGIDFIESYTGIPVVGVIPYKEDHGIEEEDMSRPMIKPAAGCNIYEDWAVHVQQHLDWSTIKKIVEEGVS